MKKIIESIKSVWQITELKEKILLTLSLLLVYRFGAQIVLPGIDVSELGKLGETFGGGGFLGILNAFTGGALSKASVFALGIMPYISASIVVQLMQVAIPYLQKLQKEGASGQKKITQITRWLTILICLVQAPFYLTGLQQLGVPASAFGELGAPDLIGNTFMTLIWVFILVAGCIFAMWLGEKITDKGIGNGISLLIMVGIIATLPSSFVQEVMSRFSGEAGTGGLMMILLEVVVWLVIILLSIMLIMAVRQVPVQYARRSAVGGYEEGARQFLPLKLNASGVMPIIFAQAIMFVPAALGNAFGDGEVAQFLKTEFGNMFGFWYNLVFALLIIVFTYLYTAMMPQSNPNKMAEDLKRSNGFIPGIKPGTETADYLDKIMSNITLPGSVFLALIAILPAFAYNLMGLQQGWALFYGGTSLLILVGVAIDTMQQVNAYLLNKHYDGLMQSGKNRKAVA
ncbi:preprotein translocase subunit SecY [Pseudofulvibacter geojedonensis]|uniref:Protein translocase subunit SecY n=1 Tax=Pseudofulvibacter geojedonensis TaxID=1123758 RepID=A0ABW3I4V0_9FLAO